MEEKLARLHNEQGRGERVLDVYKGDKNVPLASVGARGCGIFPKALTHKIFFRNGEVNPTIRLKFIGNSSEIHRRVVMSHI